MARTSTPTRRRTVRLLPVTVTMLALLFVIKVNEVYLGSRHLREMYGVRSAVAEDKQPEAKAEEAKPAEAKPVEAKAEEAAPPVASAKVETGTISEAAPAEDDKKEASAAPPAEAKGEGEAPGAAPAALPAEETTYGTGQSTVKEIEALKAREGKELFSQTEIDLLQTLSKRRDELDKREKDFEMKSKILEATEKRITDKISEMKTLEGELNKVIAQYNEKQDAQIKSLVKIYESMKPDEAAAIFNELDMPILLEVISKMSERKVAPVLANMTPKKAKDVTEELAEKRKNSAVRAASPAAR
jgi:flagellar motility protein MotE (MotC chaperone)